VSGYQHDVFISYSRRGSARKWLMNNFYKKFQECLADQLAHPPEVFIDWGMERGVHWPSRLEKALHRSKIMVAVLTPPYFESPWCRAEMESMRARERMLGLGGVDHPQGLVYRILYSDSANFPLEAREFSWWDFKAFSTPEPVFQESRDWVPFHHEVTAFAEDLAALLPQVPEWQADWPAIERPDPVLMPPPLIPRFEL
jgi:hypothetical protein